MNFGSHHRRASTEAILPMINVVFLLLIFFLMTARIAPSAPIDVTPPVAELDGHAEASTALYFSAKGDLHYYGHKGAAALTAVSQQHDSETPLILHADADVPIRALAALLNDLQTRGVAAVDLVGRSL